MGHLLFDSKVDLIDEFHLVMYDLEKQFHKGNTLEMNLCLKHDLGNKIVNNLLWSVEPPGLRKLQKCVPNCFQVLWRQQWFKSVRLYIGFFFDTLGYYLDFVKVK